MPKISLELVMLACVCSCLCDPVQNWKWSKGNIQAFLVCEFSAYLAIIWNNWKRKYLKQPQNVWHWLLAKVHLDSNEAWPDWEKKQTPMQQSRRRRVHQGNTQARDNPDPEIFVAYNIFDRLFTQNLAVPKCAACQAVQRTILTSMVMLRTQCVSSDLVCWA